MLFDHILVTTDFSEASYSAFDIASYQARIGDCKITLMSVFEEFEIPPVLQRHINDPETAKRLKTEYEEEMVAKLQELADTKFHGDKVKAVPVFSGANPGSVVAEYAKKELANLIVISSSGKGAIGKFILGSTVQQLIGEAVCPVLVIPRIDEK